MKIRLACAIALMSMVPTQAIAQQPRNDCYHDRNGSTYCVYTVDQGQTKKIIKSFFASRQGPGVITYLGNSFSPGSRFSNDHYPEQGARTILKHFSKDKIVLQLTCDPQSDCPEWTYYR